jgi:hypothetical protein
MDLIKQCKKEHKKQTTKYPELTTIISDGLKSFVEDLTHNPETPTGLQADLINAGLSEVDWYEIAESYLED